MCHVSLIEYNLIAKMLEKYVKIGNLSISESLLSFINEEALPGTNIDKKYFWKEFDKNVHTLAIRNKEILQIRRKLQLEIDMWHLNNRSKEFNQKS